jgi:hypothetical protein
LFEQWHDNISGSLSRFRPPMELSILIMPEKPFDHPESIHVFRPGADKPLLAMPAAIELYRGSIHHCLTQLHQLTDEKNCLDYLQVFDDLDRPEPVMPLIGLNRPAWRLKKFCFPV